MVWDAPSAWATPYTPVLWQRAALAMSKEWHGPVTMVTKAVHLSLWQRGQETSLRQTRGT